MCNEIKTMRRENSNKVFLITNIPTPYRIPLFNELDKQLEEKGLKLKVIFGSLGYRHRKWKIDLSECKFDFKILPSQCITLFNHEKVLFTYRGLLRLIKKENPKIVIANAFSIATTKIWLYSWFRRIRYIIWSGAIESKKRPDSKLRKIQRKLLIKRAGGFIAYGKRAKEYLINLGASPEKVEIGINTVDNDFFQRGVEKYRSTLEKRNSKKILLYVGYLVKRKRLDLLLKAIKILATKRDDFILKIVGDGTEKENLIKLVGYLGIARFVSFEGYKQKEELIKYYGEADCFLFPTDFDIWGLVLMEAMAAGLPCIVSFNSGATHDLIIHSNNGIIINFAQLEEVADKINWLLSNPDKAKEIGRRAANLIANCATIGISCGGFLRAILQINKSFQNVT